MKTQLLAFLFALGPNSLTAGRSDPGPYIAHEWGTFTSVQAADGVQMPWNPLNVEELPDFVYSLSWPSGKKEGRENVFAGKTAFFALQRMETPVIYFYGDESRNVNVSIKFPHGRITEWYPQASHVNAFDQVERNRGRADDGAIAWNHVRILAKSDPGNPLQDSSGSHYYAARSTDSNLLRVESPQGAETERFLFYRGVGAFQSPLKVTQQGDNAEAIEVQNTGVEELRHLLVYRVHGARAASTVVARLAPSEAKTVRLQFEISAVARSAFEDRAGADLLTALAGAGLYEREAAAMVQTWRDSWFREEGVRVLYLLPQHWTEQTLPLTLAPAPKDVARVMVGRAELITPAMETSLLQEIVRFASGDERSRAEAVEQVRELGLERFAEAVTRRIVSHGGVTREFSNRAWELLQAASKGSTAKQLAGK